MAGPEAANNAGAQASFIPLLCLGIPANAVIGVIMGALLIQGITPGPRLIVEHPDLFWGVIASMFVGNLMLVVLNIPLVGLFVSLLRVPHGHHVGADRRLLRDRRLQPEQQPCSTSAP